MKNKALVIIGIIFLSAVLAIFAMGDKLSFDTIKDNIGGIFGGDTDEDNSDNTDTDDSTGTDEEKEETSTVILSDGVVANIVAKREGMNPTTFMKLADNQFWHNNVMPAAESICFTNTSSDRTYYVGLGELINVVCTIAPGETSEFLGFMKAVYFIWNDQEYTPEEDELPEDTYKLYYTSDCGTVSVAKTDGTVVGTGSGMELDVGTKYVITVSNGAAPKYISYTSGGAPIKTIEYNVVAFEFTAVAAADHYLYCGETVEPEPDPDPDPDPDPEPEVTTANVVVSDTVSGFTVVRYNVGSNVSLDSPEIGTGTIDLGTVWLFNESYDDYIVYVSKDSIGGTVVLTLDSEYSKSIDIAAGETLYLWCEGDPVD